ncbi:deoxynucleoside kinase [Lactobacillus helveticus]|uniref:Deoxynucleoside kinase domain-containing protein n=1 Tax=Lactobacillus helveticus TaxID=1587 RepID=A0AAV4E7U3_LACHE|nr:deoxynucleoside kinase [Lactobacillus helveticus]AGQ23185.1 putative nucleoside/nucleotide kinase [Lactobacillus helveticus CNRZ32]KXN77224.1 thymidylate kinase [Lactobacillus helveticus]MBW7980751.1 thymidylate kinase [Lactobacillus helveticus]MBW8000163.1 thymidylate kinase [Lactobacillus helveticus]MBW8064013.1 thymidylate kinase [Lactobacillus helveticus]
MSRGKIILIDGISNSGKTTLCNNLSKQLGYKIVPESIRYLENRLNEKGDNILYVPKNIQEELRNQEILFDLEFDKWFDANYFADHGQNVVIDKSPYSIVATAFAFESSNISGTYNKSLEFLDDFIEKAKRYKLYSPDLLLLLKADSSASSKRNLERNHHLLSVWTQESTRQKQEEILEKEFQELDMKKALIDTSNLSPRDVYDEALKQITSL